VKRIELVAWGLWVAFVAMVAIATYLGFHPPTGPPITVIDAIWAASFIGFPTAGALIVPRMPRRPLGWILLVAPLLLMVGLNLSEISRHVQSDALLARWVLWISTLFFASALGPLLMTPLYLPDGRLPSPRWGWVGRAGWAMVAVTVFHAALKPGRMEADSSSDVTNPAGIDVLQPVFDVLEAALGPVFLLTLAIGVFSLIGRFRSAGGVERQQMKWLALGGAGILAPFGIITFIEFFFGDQSDGLVTILIVVAILSLPTSIAIAVQRTRLYDVDVVINRTLVYGTLTAVLALVYLGIVVVLQRLLEPITNQSDVAVAASTLAVATLARPARSSVQEFIDRRFYRRKYDAAETLAEFSTRLRDQVDLHSLSSELVAVVGSTMQPAHASLWLKGSEVVR
jgi:hypothetical protein